MKFNKYFSPTYLLCYAIALYVVGAFLMPHQDVRLLKQLGFAEQEIHTYTDNDGEEHESETLIELYEVGRILTYNDVYLSVIIFFVISLIIARFIFNESIAHKEELRFVLYTNCVIGVFLIWLTRKPCLTSTILYWAGIFMAYFSLSKLE